MSTNRSRPGPSRRSTADSSSSDTHTVQGAVTPSPLENDLGTPTSPNGDYFHSRRRRGSSSATATAAYETGAFGPPSAKRRESKDVVHAHLEGNEDQQGLIPDGSYEERLKDDGDEEGDGAEAAEGDVLFEEPVQGLDEELDLSGAADDDDFGEFEQAPRVFILETSVTPTNM